MEPPSLFFKLKNRPPYSLRLAPELRAYVDHIKKTTGASLSYQFNTMVRAQMEADASYNKDKP